MRFGLGPIELGGLHAAELRALAEAATAASFDCVWFAEARSAGVGGGLGAAAMAAQLTPIRVGAIVDLGLYHPLHLAEDIAVCDLTTGGRLEVIVRAPATVPAADLEEHLGVLVAALSGAHVQWNGRRLRVPARMDANQPVSERLALNPSPAQPAVPIWVESAELAARLGLGVAVAWSETMSVRGPEGRLPTAVLCPSGATEQQLLAAAGDKPAYFIVQAAGPAEARAVGRRLGGPLRMPDFPAWVNAD